MFFKIVLTISQLSLFIRGKLETSKIDCRDNIQKWPCLLTFSSGKQAMTANGSALLRYALIISVQKLTQVIKSNTAGFLRIQTQQENTKENTKKTTEINWN